MPKGAIMPFMKNGKRDMKREYASHGKSEANKKKRAARNKARRQMEKEGRVHKGDGKDVDHKRPLSKGGTNSRSNLRVQSASENRRRQPKRK